MIQGMVTGMQRLVLESMIESVAKKNDYNTINLMRQQSIVFGD